MVEQVAPMAREISISGRCAFDIFMETLERKEMIVFGKNSQGIWLLRWCVKWLNASIHEFLSFFREKVEFERISGDNVMFIEIWENLRKERGRLKSFYKVNILLKYIYFLLVFSILIWHFWKRSWFSVWSSILICSLC